MKYIYLSFVVLAIVLIANDSVHAQESTTTASSTPDTGLFSTIRENVQGIRENVQERVDNRQERRVALEARTQERITNLAANISNRFDGIIARLQNITDRLTKRIEKESLTGKNVTAARESLARAQGALDAAKAKMTSIDEAVRAALGSTDPRSEWKNVRATYIDAREDIRTAHTELRNTIINLKSAGNAVNTATSSTETVNN